MSLCLIKATDASVHFKETRKRKRAVLKMPLEVSPVVILARLRCEFIDLILRGIVSGMSEGSERKGIMFER